MGVQFGLSYREETPRWLVVSVPVFTVLAALAVGALPLLALDANPVAVYTEMFITTTTNANGIGRVLTKLVPLLLAGLAVYFPLKAGLINIGAEGSIYVGGIVATWVALSTSFPGALQVVAMAVVAMAVGGLWLLVPAFLLARWDVNEIIVSVFMAFIAIELNEYAIRGPLQGTTGFPASPSLPSAARLPTFAGVHVGILVVPIAVVGIYLLMNRTRTGYEILVMGSNADAAEQAGISKMRTFVLTMVVGGALAGLAGMIEIAGVQGKLISGFSPGYGFTAIPIALLGENGAFRVLLASVFFAVLFVGGISVSASFGVPTSLVNVIEALVILFLITGEFFTRFDFYLGFDRFSIGTAEVDVE